MKDSIYLIYFLIVALPLSLTQVYKKGDAFYDKCMNLSTFPILPATSFDILDYTQRGVLFEATNWDECTLTVDGLYKIPKGFYANPIKETTYQYYATSFSSLKEYSHAVKEDIKAHGSAWGVSGSFEEKTQTTTKEAYYSNSMITRVKVSHTRYLVQVNPDTPLVRSLHEVFQRIMEYQKIGQMRAADYLCQTIYRDYGGLYQSLITVGAMLYQEDLVDKQKIESSQLSTTDVSASASEDFYGSFGVSGSKSVSDSTIQKYLSARTQSRQYSIGGKLRANMTLDHFEDTVDGNLITIKREANLLLDLITPERFEEWNQPQLYGVWTCMFDALEAYFHYNTYEGCCSEEAANFDLDANLCNDKSCKSPSNNFTVAGVFQTCTSVTPGVDSCAQFEQPNYYSGGFSCPEPDVFTPVLLHTGVVTTPLTYQQCYDMCLDAPYLDAQWQTWFYHVMASGYLPWFWWSDWRWSGIERACSSYCSSYASSIQVEMEISSYWCAATKGVPPSSGALYGAGATPVMANPTTGKISCPNNYDTFKFLANSIQCFSRDYELARDQAFEFGGFFSCNTGNPMAGPSSPQRCPDGFAQHPLGIYDNCQVYYCLRSGALSKNGTRTVIRPPYINSTILFQPKNISLLTPCDRQTLLSKKGTLGASDSCQSMTSLSSPTSKNTSINTSSILFGTFGGIMGIITLGSVTALLYYKYTRRPGYYPIS